MSHPEHSVRHAFWACVTLSVIISVLFLVEIIYQDIAYTVDDIDVYKNTVALYDLMNVVVFTLITIMLVVGIRDLFKIIK